MMANQMEQSSKRSTSGAGNQASTTDAAAPPGATQQTSGPGASSGHSPRSASDLADDAKQNIRKGAKEGQQLAAELGDQAKHQVCKATDQAKETTRQYAVEKKRQIAEELGVFSSAIQNAAKTLRDEEHGAVAQYVEAAAEQLESAREAVQNKPIGEFFEDMQDFTRRRPEVVFGGLFIAGMAAMRFAKASRPVSDQRGARTRSGRPTPSVPAQRSNVAPPPGFESSADGRPRPADRPSATNPSTSPTRNP